jgi:hypothetical protein
MIAAQLLTPAPLVDYVAANVLKALLVHTPTPREPVQQIEIYSSIVQCKVLTPDDFRSLTAVKDRLRQFQARYEATASLFQWTFTRRDCIAS